MFSENVIYLVLWPGNSIKFVPWSKSYKSDGNSSYYENTRVQLFSDYNENFRKTDKNIHGRVAVQRFKVCIEEKNTVSSNYFSQISHVLQIFHEYETHRPSE